jgi:hypothetical protein
MADIRINQDSGDLAVPDQAGGYRIYKRSEYKLDQAAKKVFVPDRDGSGRGVVFDLPAPKQTGPVFNPKEMGRSFMLGTRQTIEGLASPITMTADAINAVANLPIKGANALFGTEIPEFQTASGSLNRALIEGAGFPEERSDQEHLLGAVVKGGSGALATGGTATIPAFARAFPGLATALGMSPGSQVVGGMAGSGAAEGTRQGLQDITLFENDTGDAAAKMALQMLAGVGAGVGGYGASRAVVNTAGVAKNAVQGVTDLLTTAGRERIAGNLLRQASGGPETLPARLEDAVTYGSAIPGIRPTTAQALGGDTQMSALELGIRNDPVFRQAFDTRAAENQTTRTAALNSIFPQGAGSADDLAAGVRVAWDQSDDAGRREIAAAMQRAQQRLAELGNTVDQQAAGEIIREEVEAAYSATKSRTGAAYRAIDPEQASSFSGQEIWQRAVNPTIENYFADTTTGTPTELREIVSRLGRSNNLTFRQVDAMRRELSNIAGKAAMSGDRSLAAAAGEMADSIRAHVDDMAAAGRGFTPEQAQSYQAARDLRRDQGQKFERGAVGNVTKRGPYGEHRAANSEVPAELFFRGGGSPEAAEQFIAAVGDRPRAVQALSDHIATQLRQRATNPDGTVNGARMLEFQMQHAGALQQFPELSQRIGNLVEAQAAVDQATLASAARQAEMRGSPLNNFLTKNPADAVASIIGSRNSQEAMRQVAESVAGNAASRGALKRSVVEWINRQIETSGVQPVSGEPVQSFARLKRIMDTKLDTLRQVLSKDEITTLQDFAEQMMTEARVTSAKPLGSNTFSNLATRSLVERATGGLVPMEGAQSALTPSLGWIFRNVDANVRQSINDALLNPQDALRMVNRARNIPVRDLPLELRRLGIGAGGQVINQGINQSALPPALAAILGAGQTKPTQGRRFSRGQMVP